MTGKRHRDLSITGISLIACALLLLFVCRDTEASWVMLGYDDQEWPAPQLSYVVAMPTEPRYDIGPSGQLMRT